MYRCRIGILFISNGPKSIPIEFYSNKNILKKYNNNVDDDKLGVMLGGHVRAVFTLVTVIFIGCVSVTLDSFREIPLWRLESVSQSATLNDDNSTEPDVKVTAAVTTANANATAITPITLNTTNSTEQSALNEKLQAPDTINRTTSYGALSNQTSSSHLDVPKTAVRRNYYTWKMSNLK